MRIGLLNTDYNNDYRLKYNKYGGVAYYRLILPQLALQSATDWTVDFLDSTFMKTADSSTEETTLKSYIDLIGKYDVIVIKHFDNPNAARFLLAACDITKTKIITDLDDDVFSVREDQPASKLGYNPGEVKRATVGTMLSFSDGLFVTNDYLGKRVQEYVKKACGKELPYFVLPNTNNIEDWSKFKPRSTKTNITIGWHGSLTHDSDIRMVLPAIKAIMEKYPKVNLDLMGGIKKEFALDVFKNWDAKLLGRIKLTAGTQAWEGFPYKLLRKNWDIGIAPLIDDEFNRCKSNIKWMEYAMKKIPCIASDVLPYQNIKHGVDGYLVKTEEEWYDTLELLVKDNELRKEIGQNAHEEVKNNWQFDKVGEAYKKAFESVLKSN